MAGAFRRWNGYVESVGTGQTLYLMDEPTTGLHFDDIRLLLKVLNKLVDRDNTVIVIEHHLDVMKSADWIIDLGPEGGEGGGHILAAGTPEDSAALPDNHTGRFLAPTLSGRFPHSEDGTRTAQETQRCTSK